MKKLILTAATVVALSVTAQAGMYTSIVGLGMKSQPTDATWALDVVGEDTRVYEFTTKTEPKMKCVAFFSESKYKSPVMQCTPIKYK